MVFNRIDSLFVLTLSLSLASCDAIQVDENERVGVLPAVDGPTLEFDPSAGVISFPNELLRTGEQGRVNLPEQCEESAAQTALRTLVLNALDGFGAYKAPIRFTTTEPVDVATLEGRVLLYPVGASNPVPVTYFVGSSKRFTSDCSASSLVPTVTVVPMVPLQGDTRYALVVLDGVKTETGVPLIPSVTWSLVRQGTNPVTIVDGKIVAERTPFDPATDQATLIGLDLLWNAHSGLLTFLEGVTQRNRDNVLLAASFKTQTLRGPLDSSLEGSPAHAATGSSIKGPGGAQAPVSIAGGNGEAFLEQQFGKLACASLGCSHVGDVLVGQISLPNFQTPAPNPALPESPAKGPWSDPLTPQQISVDEVEILASIPKGDVPEGGFPTVIFAHGLTRSKKDMLALSSQFAFAGIAMVAIDWPGHGSRAVQVSTDAALGCVGEVDPTEMPQCFAPFLSANLATTRDSSRQGALDMLHFARSLSDCGEEECGALQINSNAIGFIGMSLGSIVGTVALSEPSPIRTAVLNTGGVGLLDVVENSDNLRVRCSLVDALVRMGVIDGTPFDPATGTGTCVGQEWKQDPGYRQFAAIARWILDPADGVHFASRTVQQMPIFIQEAEGDSIVPNSVTRAQGMLMGLSPESSLEELAPLGPLVPRFFSYKNSDEESYTHQSLLAPEVMDAAGFSGTKRMQTDAITYLLANLGMQEGN